MTHAVVSAADWESAREQLLRQEKEFTRLRDELNAARRALPWKAVTKEYTFHGADGAQTLAQLFDNRSQLIVYHFMFAPQSQAGCPHCSRWADNFNGGLVHLRQRDVTMVAVSRAPYAKLAAYRQRMGWNFPWLSSGEGDFNFDFGVSFRDAELAAQRARYNYAWQDPGASDREGVSVFLKDGAQRVFHTYSTYARGIDLLNTDYNLLDLTPRGRDEGGRGPYWVRRHDEYEGESQR
jgi:predicted dithiol-disulfide oxidoreductase (DUF899 family)